MITGGGRPGICVACAAAEAHLRSCQACSSKRSNEGVIVAGRCSAPLVSADAHTPPLQSPSTQGSGCHVKHAGMEKVGRHNTAITISGQTASRAPHEVPWDASTNTLLIPASQKTARSDEMLQGKQEKPVSAEPKYTTIAGWSSMTGMSRSNIYRAIGRGDLKAIKLGRATRIDVEHGMAWMRSLPKAQVRVAA